MNGQIDDEFKGMVAGLASTGSGSPFTINRLILKQVNEAIYCLQEGVATAEDIDRAMVLGTGFPNKDGIGGPLHWADEKGLDWVLSSLEELAVKKDPVSGPTTCSRPMLRQDASVRRRRKGSLPINRNQ